MSKVNKIQEACQILKELDVNLKTENVPVAKAYGRVVAENIMSKYAVPSFPKSAYDGYALRCMDIKDASKENPITLKVTETIPAGSVGKYPILERMAAKIMTGAMLPEGADTVVKYEDTSCTQEEVTFFAPAQYSNIVEPGEDIRQNVCLIEHGKVIEAAHVAVLAGQGFQSVCVYKQPEIAILGTGSELLILGQELAEGKVYNTNTYLLSGYIKKYGMIPKDCGIVADDIQKLVEKIEAAFEKYDMVITTGGVSAGDFDYIPKVADCIGAKILFHRLPFKPGGAMLAAEKRGKVLLGLSGNPGAAAVGMLWIGLPYMKKLCGRLDIELPEAVAVMEEPFSKRSKGTRFLRGKAHIQKGRLVFCQNENQKNGAVSSMIDCDVLGEVPSGCPGLLAGAEIKVYFI